MRNDGDGRTHTGTLPQRLVGPAEIGGPSAALRARPTRPVRRVGSAFTAATSDRAAPRSGLAPCPAGSSKRNLQRCMPRRGQWNDARMAFQRRVQRRGRRVSTTRPNRPTTARHPRPRATPDPPPRPPPAGRRTTRTLHDGRPRSAASDARGRRRRSTRTRLDHRPERSHGMAVTAAVRRPARAARHGGPRRLRHRAVCHSTARGLQLALVGPHNHVRQPGELLGQHGAHVARQTHCGGRRRSQHQSGRWEAPERRTSRTRDDATQGPRCLNARALARHALDDETRGARLSPFGFNDAFNDARATIRGFNDASLTANRGQRRATAKPDETDRQFNDASLKPRR